MLSSGWHSNGTGDDGRRMGCVAYGVAVGMCKSFDVVLGAVLGCTRVKVVIDGDFGGACRIVSYLKGTRGSRPYARVGKY